MTEKGENQRSDQHYGGRGDPERTMALLWRVGSAGRSAGPPARGPKPKLTVDQIVRTGIELADSDGLAALSMRRVAERLGVGTMSLYTYVPSKAELVDVMFDTALGELARPKRRPATWRERLEDSAWQNFSLCRRHPWLLQVMAMSRPPLGPNSVANYDYDLRAVEGIGLSDLEMDSVVSTMAVFVQGAARAAVESAGSERVTGVTDLQWWEIYGPLVDKYFDAEKYPTAARVGEAFGAEYQSAYDPDHGFRFGLARFLDGVAVLIESRSG
jgi:AcrR family transcriptional regulator